MSQPNSPLPSSIGRSQTPLPSSNLEPAPWILAPPPGGDFADTLRKLWRRKWIIVGSVCVALVLAAAASAVLPARYTATVQLRVGVPSPKVTDIQAVVTGASVDVAAVQSETYMLRSRGIAGRVAERLGLENVAEFNPALQPETLWDRVDPRRLFRAAIAFLTPERAETARTAAASTDEPVENPEREAIIGTLLSRIEITPLDRSHVIAVGAQSEDPLLAARIANTWARTYIEDQLVRKVELTEHADKWLGEHIRRLREQVAKDESAVENYRRDHGLFKSRAETMTSQQLAEINTQMILAQATRAEAEARLKQAQALLRSNNPGDTMPEVLNSPLIQALIQQQATVERRVAELSANYGAKHPQMRNAQAELNDIRRNIRTEIQKVIGGLRNAAETAKARHGALRANLETTKRAAGADNTDTIALRALEREAEASSALFQQFLQRSKETSVQRDMQTPDAQVVSAAAVPVTPSFPPVNMLFAVAVIGGILVGILLVLLVEQMDSTFRTEDELEEQTGLRALAAIPKVSRWKQSYNQVLKQPTSAYSEAMRKLDITMRLTDPANPSKIVMVASGAANEGKSGICLSLARMAAASGSNVIVIDCDWRRPKLHTMLRRPNKLGLGELLTGRVLPDDVVYRDTSGAHMIFAGQLKPRHMHLLFSDRMRYLLQSLTRHYDLVLIDTPPVTVGAEILHLSQMVDKTIYVVRWGHTPRTVALKGLRQLAAIGAPVAGVVLSQVDAKRYGKYAHTGNDYLYRSYASRRTA